jgi:hypothetical protein
MDSTTIDLRQRTTVRFLVDAGVQYLTHFSVEGQELDSGYTLVIAGQTYTVGNGLKIEKNTNSIIWELDTRSISPGKYKGDLVSDSTVFGKFLKIRIKLEVL